MKEIAFETIICILSAALIMIIHELSKAAAYIFMRKRQQQSIVGSEHIWHVWRYIDPVGIILAVTCFVPVSKPHMFRIRDKLTNKVLGITGFAVLLILFIFSVFLLNTGNLGIGNIVAAGGILGRFTSIFLQYTAILSFDMFIVNMFPISTFDMGLLIAGASSGRYLQIIKADSLIKLILLLTLMLDLIHFGCIKLLRVILNFL